MRVALYDNLLYSGGKRQEYEFARGLQAGGHEVDLYTTTAADSAFLDWADVTSERFEYVWPEPFPLPARLPGVRGYLVAAEVVTRYRRVADLDRQIASDIDRRGYDVVLVHHCPLAHGPYLLRFLHTPAVYYCNEPMREFYDPPIDRPYFHAQSFTARSYRQWYAPARTAVDRFRRHEDYINVRRAPVLATNSRFTAESIYRAYGKNAYVSYLGVDTVLFAPHHTERQNMVLSVGEVKPHKGFDFVITALGRVPETVRPELLLVGNTVVEKERAYLHDLARAHGVTLRVRQLVSDQELVALHNSAQAFVYGSRLEPFGLAPVESMACGTPVIAVAEGGVRESVRDGVTGFLTQRDPEDFANALVRVLADPDLRRKLGENAVSVVRSFWTWPAACARFMDVVRKTVTAPTT